MQCKHYTMIPAQISRGFHLRQGRIGCASLADMNEATRLENTAAMILIASAIELLENHYADDDMDAAVQAVLAKALELAANRPLKPIEELYHDK